MGVSILIFLLIFSVIVIGHEFGHYAIARRSGIRVKEFDIGMGPSLVEWQRGETKFCIKPLPFGGACIFDGMDALEDSQGEYDEHAFRNAGVWQRIATVLAGPMMNFIIGFLLALVIVGFSGSDLPVVNSVMENSAAQEAGLEAGDTIVRINHTNIHLYREISVISMLNYGESMDVTYERDGVRKTVTLTPKYYEDDGRYYIGLVGGGNVLAPKGLNLVRYAFYEAQYWARATFMSLGSMLKGHFSLDDLAGPVGVVQVVDETYEATKPLGLPTMVLSFLNLSCLLTINLGIMNLLPIPALDGGRLLLLLIEVVRGKPLPPEKEGMVHLIGAALLFMLVIAVLFNDIARLFR
ncbi:MAG: RIP metalloprotease RseP [Lachnospiraceae bacterium]|nr:RIP metalloprotease RseP [Lachnospiraceae bacterium]